MKSYKKILLIRFSSIGDIVLTTPVVRALKTQLGSELHVLTKEKFSSIYKNNPYIDRVHIYSDEKVFVRELKAEQFDLIVDLQKNWRSIRVRRALKKPAVSFPKINVLKWLAVNCKLNTLPDVHIVDRYFKAVENYGVSNDGKGLDYFIPQNSAVHLKRIAPVLTNGYIAIAIGGQHYTKILPAEKLIRIISKMSYPVILLGDENDRKRGDEVLQRINKRNVFNACGFYSLDQSASIIEQSLAVVSNDTGLMHIAAAFNKPIVSVWGNTIPAFGMYPYLPEKPELSVVSEVSDLKCRPCSKLGFKQCPKAHFKCMMDQDEDFISDSIQKLIEK